MSEDQIYRVQHIRAEHTHFINHQEFKFLNQLKLCLVETDVLENSLWSSDAEIPFVPISPAPLSIRNKRPKGQLKEGMHGHSAGVDRGHPGRRHDYQILSALFFHMFQKGRFSSAGFASQENMLAGLIHKLQRHLKPGIRIIGFQHGGKVGIEGQLKKGKTANKMNEFPSQFVKFNVGKFLSRIDFNI